MGRQSLRRQRPAMHDIDVRERLGPTHRAVGPAFDLTVSKLLRPLVRPGTIRRSLLLGHLENEGSRRIVSVVAPAGYGKTTLLSQWAERNGQAFAWVSVDDRDNDPKVLLAYIAEALDAVEPVGGRVFDALTSPASSVPGSVVPRLAAAFAARTVPIVLVLDDVHLLRNRVCRDALSVLAEHVPDGSRLVLAGRTEPPLRISRLRAEGRILEIGPADLSLTPEEAARLLCVMLARCSVRMRWRRCTSGPRDGQPGCIWRRCICRRAGRCQARRSPSAATTGWSASTWSRSSWRGSPGSSESS